MHGVIPRLTKKMEQYDTNSEAYKAGERLAHETIKNIRLALSPSVVRGQIWQKRAHCKTSVNAPRIIIESVTDKSAVARPLNFTGYGFHFDELRTMRKTTLLKDWFPQ